MTRIAGRPPRTAGGGAFTIVEFLVVLAILAVALGLLLPAVQKARAAADRSACANNLRQFGIASHQHADATGAWPRYRRCPAPWRNGQDLHCETVPALNFYTGANEVWWAPYDNRVGPTDPALPDFDPRHSILWSYLGVRRAFNCPNGIDMEEGSPTKGKPFQISYAMDFRLGGGRLGSVSAFTPAVWDHMDLPGCASAATHWMDAAAGNLNAVARHGPNRHAGVYNVLYLGGHVVSTVPAP